MQPDKALKKVLMSQSESLPYGFESRVMAQISMFVAKKKRRNAWLTISLLSAVSVLLAGGGYFLLNKFFEFKLKLSWPTLSLSPESSNMLTFCLFIAGLVLILLIADLWLRKIKEQE